MQKINSQITTLTAKPDIILKKQQQKNTNTETFENNKASIQSIIEQLESSNVDTIYDDPKLLFEFIIKYLSPPNTTIENINIDLFVKFYLNGAMGNPNSIGNIGKLVDSITDFELLKTHCKPLKDITDFKGLTGDDINYLEHFLNQKDYKDCLQKHKKLKAAEAEAKKGADILINITNEFGSIVVYWLKTKAAAKFYGQLTKWCTAAEKENKFEYYNSKGKIYMITVKKKGENASRYQLHAEKHEFMDESNEPYDIQAFMELITQIDSEKVFSDWFMQTYVYQLSEDKTTLNISKNIRLGYISYLLDRLTNLQSLTFVGAFNQPLKGAFNQPLNDSLNGLTHLQSLTFGFSFNKPLGNSLDRLTELQSLTFGYNFNKPLDNSLNELTKLQSLTFGREFKQTLGESLNGLIKLESLTFGYAFNETLGESLNGLTNLKSLTFGDKFNKPLDNSLNGLTNLKSLTFGDEFNKPLDNSLNGLIKLESLTFGYAFNEPLGESLNGLTNLKSLTFGDEFYKPLDNSLNGLIKLESLTFGYAFNEPLDNSLNGLTNLKSLTFGDGFNEPLGDSLNGLTHLQSLTFGYAFNKPLDNSLNKLQNLQNLKFYGDYKQPFNIKQLSNLKELVINGTNIDIS